MSIAVMIITDAPPPENANHPRFKYLQYTIHSLEQFISGDITYRFIVADCVGNEDFRRRVINDYGARYPVLLSDHKMGFAGAIERGWQYAVTLPVEYIFHVEADFEFLTNVNLDAMAEVLEVEPKLAQLALLRQPWNPEEVAAGGIIQKNLYDFCCARTERDDVYVSHDKFFTTNPSLYRKSLIERGWPQEEYSEGKFTFALKKDGYHFGYWQHRLFAEPKVRHIGMERTGVGY